MWDMKTEAAEQKQLQITEGSKSLSLWSAFSFSDGYYGFYMIGRIFVFSVFFFFLVVQKWGLWQLSVPPTHQFNVVLFCLVLLSGSSLRVHYKNLAHFLLSCSKSPRNI